MTPQTLLNKDTVPSGGFRFLDPDTQTWIKAPSWSELLTAARKHRKANNLPVGLLFDQEVETQLCESMPPGVCTYTDDKQRKRAGLIARNSVEKFIELTRFMGERLLGKAPLVSQDEAEKHARICVGCPYNSKPEGCTSCNSGTIKEAIAFALGVNKSRTTSHDSRLQACLLCGCSLKVKVHQSPAALRKIASPDFLEIAPPHCWILDL